MVGGALLGGKLVQGELVVPFDRWGVLARKQRKSKKKDDDQKTKDDYRSMALSHVTFDDLTDRL